jgi:hypothetical protein
MGKRLLRMFISCGGTQSYFLNLILLALNRCAELFSGIELYDNIGEVREIYLNGILETYAGLIGGNTLACLLAPPEEDCLDDRRKSGDELYVISMTAAYLGRIEDLKLLVTLGLEVNRNHEGPWLYPPLIAASFGGKETAARFLVEHGADPHTVIQSKESSNENAIHFAALGGHVSLIQFLVGHGANPRSENVFGDTPLIWAAAAGHSDVVRILLTYYSDFSEKRWQLETVLDWAAVRRYDDVVEEILKDPVTRYSRKRVWS